MTTETVWECADHTRAKHEILRRYLAAWFPILAKYNGKVVYIDGFAGPGEYEDGQPGSPLVALQIAKEQQKYLTDNEIVFAFIEENKNRLNNLKSILERTEKPKNFTVHAIQSRFVDVITEELNELDRNEKVNAPLFAFIDQFGFSSVPFIILSRLLGREQTEAFVYFARDSVNRFLNVDKVEHHMKALFGVENLELPDGPQNRVEKVKIMYEARLKEIASYVGCFTMINSQNKPLYDLFFVSNNSKGYHKMKEAMWAVDAEGGFCYSDRTNHSQQLLFQPDPTPKLEAMILERANGRKGVRYESIETWIIEKTIYLPKHLKKALKQLEAQGNLTCQMMKSDGNKRKANTFPSGSIIDF